MFLCWTKCCKNKFLLSYTGNKLTRTTECTLEFSHTTQKFLDYFLHCNFSFFHVIPPFENCYSNTISASRFVYQALSVQKLYLQVLLQFKQSSMTLFASWLCFEVYESLPVDFLSWRAHFEWEVLTLSILAPGTQWLLNGYLLN